MDVLVKQVHGGVSIEPATDEDQPTAQDLCERARLQLDKGELFSCALSLTNFDAVVNLCLSRCCLTSLPDGLVVLQSLLQLDVSYNVLKKAPVCLQLGLDQLEYLDVSHNRIADFSHRPACYKRLRILRLQRNALINIPIWILRTECFNLRELYYSDNEVCSMSPSKFHITTFYKLRLLEMNNCHIRSVDASFFKYICTLRILDLSNVSPHKHNCFVDCQSFTNMFVKPRWNDTLLVLKLNNLGINNLPDEIATIINLQELHLAHNQLTWLPDTLSSVSSLTYLDVSYNNLINLALDTSRMTRLNIVKAAHNALSQINNFFSNTLTYLDLYDNYLDADCSIRSGSFLRALDLDQNYCDTGVFQISHYDFLKRTLRQDITESRVDGFKEPVEISEIDTCSDEWPDENDHSIIDDAKFGAFEDDTEMWIFDRDKIGRIDGCSLSDDEWLGYEETIKPTVRQKAPSPPDQVFEDA